MQVNVPRSVPDKVKPSLFRKSLRKHNIREELENYKNTLSKEKLSYFNDEWESAISIGRNEDFIIEFFNWLELTEDKIDDIFKDAEG